MAFEAKLSLSYPIHSTVVYFIPPAGTSERGNQSSDVGCPPLKAKWSLGYGLSLGTLYVRRVNYSSFHWQIHFFRVGLLIGLGLLGLWLGSH